MKQIFLFIIMGSILYSCENFLEVGPNVNELDVQLVFENDNTAEAALNGIYFELQKSGFASGNTSSITFLGNTLVDDAIEYNYENDRYEFYQNKLYPNNEANYNIWSSAYKQVYNVNAMLEGVEKNINLSQEINDRIIGESLFIRAFIYYYLMNLYDQVPLILTTDYKINQSMEKTDKEKIKIQIFTDLLESLEFLNDDYFVGSGEHIIPTKYAALTMLARLSLQEKDYNAATDYSTMIIESGKFSLTPVNEVFKANSQEAIWQLLPVDPSIGNNEGYLFILENSPQIPWANSSQAFTDDFLSIWNEGDLRYTQWINVYSEGNNHYYYPFKYKIKSGGDTEEYSMVMRLAELYLIRAEAQAMLGNVDQALADLNIIRNRAGLPDWTLSDVTDIKQMVLEERRRELFSEWGHRWLDLKRFGKIDEILGEKKPQWSPHAKLLPIPEQDLLRNPFLTQNPGY